VCVEKSRRQEEVSSSIPDRCRRNPFKNSSLPQTSVEEVGHGIHRIHPELLERQVRVLVVGCGGTGSAVVAGLPYLINRLWPRPSRRTACHGCRRRLRSPPLTVSASLRAVRDRPKTKAIILVNRLKPILGTEVEAASCFTCGRERLFRAVILATTFRAHIVVSGAWIHGRRGLRSVNCGREIEPGFIPGRRRE